MSKEVVPDRGQKTIALTIRFWTNEIASEGKVSPGKCWDSGMARFDMNEAHGITDHEWVPFANLAGLSEAIRRAAERAGVELLPSK